MYISKSCQWFSIMVQLGFNAYNHQMGHFVFSAVYSRRNTLVKTPNIKFHRIFMEWGPNCPTQTDERDRDITRLTVAFRNFLNAPKTGSVMEERWRGTRWRENIQLDTWSCGHCKKWTVMFSGLVLWLFIVKHIQKALLNLRHFRLPTHWSWGVHSSVVLQSVGLRVVYQSSRVMQSRDYKCLCGSDRRSWNAITTPCNIPEKWRPHTFWFVRSLKESVLKTWASLSLQWTLPVPAGVRRWYRLLRRCWEPRYVPAPPSSLLPCYKCQLWFCLWRRRNFGSTKFWSDRKPCWDYRRLWAQVPRHSHRWGVCTWAREWVLAPSSPSAPIAYARNGHVQCESPSSSASTYQPFLYYELSCDSPPGFLPLRTASRPLLYVTEVRDSLECQELFATAASKAKWLLCEWQLLTLYVMNELR